MVGIPYEIFVNRKRYYYTLSSAEPTWLFISSTIIAHVVFSNHGPLLR